MKQKFFLKGLLMSFMLLCVAQTWAYDFEVDNIQYTITSFDDLTVKVSGLSDKTAAEVVIPETVEYRDRTLTVTSIGTSAFGDCVYLINVSIGNSVTSISSHSFQNCCNLPSVIIPNSVTDIGTYAFDGCLSLASVTIGNSVTSIGGYAFRSCLSLKEITIPSTVTSIENYAFQECTSLTEVTIPNSVTSIRNYAFDGCLSLASVTIGNSVTSIGNYAFQECTSLTEVTIPNSVTSIGNYAFNGCTSLAKASINSLEISEYMFNNCSSLTKVTIGDSVESIGKYAFYGCSSLTDVTIGRSVTSIGKYAFYGCSSLKELDIPDSVTELGTDALVGCKNLESLSVGVGLRELLEYNDCNVGALYKYVGTRYELNGAYISEATNRPLLWTDGPSQMKNIILRDGASSLAVKGYYSSKTNEGVYPIFSNIDVNYFYVGRPLSYTQEFSFSDSFFGYSASLTATVKVSQPYGIIHTLEIGGYCTNVRYFYQSIENLILGENVTTYTTENIYQGDLKCIMCKSTIPPTLSSTFANLTYTDVTLYVPMGSKTTYQATEGWKNFWNIKEMEVDDMTPVEKVASEKEGPTISAHDGSIIVNGANGAMIKVYNLSGQVVYSGSDTIIPIANNGIYIVKVNGTTKKVVVK